MLMQDLMSPAFPPPAQISGSVIHGYKILNQQYLVFAGGGVLELKV
jgi:hypothetical protein